MLRWISIARDIFDLRQVLIIVAAFFCWKFAAGGGLQVAVEFAEVLPFMLMGGMCSEDLMARIITSATHLAFAIGASSALVFMDVRNRLFEQRTERAWAARLKYLRIEQAFCQKIKVLTPRDWQIS